MLHGILRVMNFRQRFHLFDKGPTYPTKSRHYSTNTPRIRPRFGEMSTRSKAAARLGLDLGPMGLVGPMKYHYWGQESRNKFDAPLPRRFSILYCVMSYNMLCYMTLPRCKRHPGCICTRPRGRGMGFGDPGPGNGGSGVCCLTESVTSIYNIYYRDTHVALPIQRSINVVTVICGLQ